MINDETVLVPVMSSVLPARRHPEQQAIWSHHEKFVEEVFRDTARGSRPEFLDTGTHLNTGAGYACDVHPGGQVDRVILTSRFYTAWAFIDDCMDNSLDLDYITGTLESFIGAFHGRSAAGPEFRVVADVFAGRDWTDEARRLCTSELDRWSEVTRLLRTTEITKNPVTIEQYLDLRAVNAAMAVIHAFVSYVQPELEDQLLAASETYSFRSAARHSGAATGIALDLGNINAAKPESAAWCSIIPVIQRNADNGCTRQHAIDIAVSMFRRLDTHTASDLDNLAHQYPTVAEVMRYAHGGNVRWMKEARGSLRYGPPPPAAIRLPDTDIQMRPAWV